MYNSFIFLADYADKERGKERNLNVKSVTAASSGKISKKRVQYAKYSIDKQIQNNGKF